jgi:tight adherence protein B
MREGRPVSDAIVVWSRRNDAIEGLSSLGRRVALGQPAWAAAEATLPSWGLDRALSLCEKTGADLAGVLDGLAEWHESATAHSRRARAASAGATLSARMLGALPLLGVAIAPAARAPLFDRTGIMVLGLGAALMVAGMRWMSRLVPKPGSEPDQAAWAGALIAAALECGAPIAAAIEAASVAGAGLGRARRGVRLAQTWSEALRSSGDAGLIELAEVIERACRTGSPAAISLRRWAAFRRERLEAEHHTLIARSAVRMVVPLTVCVLPAFVLMAVVPYMRGLAAT